jgi:hypothetical protein
LTLLASLTSPVALAEGPTLEQANTPLTAVTKRPEYAFASLPQGLFRASLKAKRWERLTTPPGMPTNGSFAGLPETSKLVIYIASRSTFDKEPVLAGARYGLYLSRDDGATWDLITERDDIGPALLLPDGGLFAIAGQHDPINGGRSLLRSTDLGKTWRDISGGDFHVNLKGLEPDPDHPGLVRLHGWALRSYIIVADDMRFRWRTMRKFDPSAPKRMFFHRNASSTNRFYLYMATLSNYFGYDFGNATSDHALEVVPAKTRFEFAKGAPVAVPLKIVFHYDPEFAEAEWRKAEAKGRHFPKPSPPTEKLAIQPTRTDFWGLRIESPDGNHAEKYPSDRYMVTMSGTTTPDGKTVTKESQPPRVEYRVFRLSPSSPYERTLDLRWFHDFSKAGTYRVQLIYSSGGHPRDEEGVWDGSFTSPVFTVVIRE